MKNPGLAFLGLVLLVPGGIFFFQGIGVLTGIKSTMVGETRWAVIGAVLALAGLAAIAVGMVRPAKARDDY